jgi:EmrB/QacA subfamily drug resistance transporter
VPADTQTSTCAPGETSADQSRRRGRWFLLAVVLAGELMSALDASMVDTALPAIQADTGASAAGLQWIYAAYSLTFAIGMITGCRLGDLHGRKRLFLLGAGVFTAASLLCGLATGPVMLIAARVVQAAGAAAMVPQVLATLHVTFADAGPARARAFGLYGVILPVGGAIGPALGGLLTQADVFGLGWRPIFLINVPLGLATVLLGRRVLPETRADRALRLDPAGIALSALGLLLIAYSLSEGGAHHWPWWTFTALATGAATLAGLMLQQRVKTRKDGSPLIELALFSRRPFCAGLTAQLVLGLLSGLLILCWTLFMQHGLGLSPSQAGIVFVVFSLAEMAGAWLATMLVTRHQRRVPQAGALLAALAVGVFHLLVTIHGAGLSMADMTAPVVALGVGIGLISAPLTNLTLDHVPESHTGSASGLFNTAIYLGIALGAVFSGVVFFTHDPHATARGTAVADAFATALPYVTGGLLIMWTLMFLLPRPSTRHTSMRDAAG